MSEAEIWKPVVGFEGLYEVSSLGRLRSVDRYVNVLHRNGKTFLKHYRSVVLRQQVRGTADYLGAHLSKGGVVVPKLTHTLVLEAFVGPCPEGCEGRHLNCENYDNRLSNLAYGTRKKNREDSRREGTLAVGERIAQHKLTEDQVKAIRASTLSSNVLARLYPVQARQIRRIRSRELWKHV